MKIRKTENVTQKGEAVSYTHLDVYKRQISYRNGSLTEEKIQEVRDINPGFMNNC